MPLITKRYRCCSCGVILPGWLSGAWRLGSPSVAAARFYPTQGWGMSRYPRLQILTIAQLLGGKGIDYPRASNVTFRAAPRARAQEYEALPLPLAAEDDPPY